MKYHFFVNRFLFTIDFLVLMTLVTYVTNLQILKYGKSKLEQTKNASLPTPGVEPGPAG